MHIVTDAGATWAARSYAVLLEALNRHRGTSRPLTRFSSKYVRDLVSLVKKSQAASTTAWVPY